MVGFKNVAIVNLVEDVYKTDYGFALYDTELDNLKYNKDGLVKGQLVVVNPRNKDKRIVGVVKSVKSLEEYGKTVTAQVVGVVDTEGFDARKAEEDRLAEITKKKKEIEKELKAEVEKIMNLELYENMANKYPENKKLTELVNVLKELDLN